MEYRPVRVWSIAEGDIIAYGTYRPSFSADEPFLWRKGIVPLARANFDIGQVHLHVDVAELPLFIDSIGDVANDILRGHFARHRLDGLVHSIGERGGVTAGSYLQSVVAFIRRRR